MSPDTGPIRKALYLNDLLTRDLGKTYPTSQDIPAAKNYLQKKKAAAQQSQGKLWHHAITTHLCLRDDCLKAGSTA